MRHSKRSNTVARPGFSLVEAVVCMVVLSLVLVAAMQVAGAANVAQAKVSERVTGRLLADGLLSEIVPLAYADPGASPVFGREAGESTSSKQAYNDVDDFNGWTESPPLSRTNVEIVGMTDWTRSVAVQWVNVPVISQVSVNETGAKRITVTVTRNGRVIATAVAIRTKYK
ncbi:MAG: prepilin-type N-terminal cleavage/methylation domain-containing protein [Planctomycetes bacterium]|nr:prepilin-type N-terminal cleavage/methylation domain-containing protein [Planctomycetota bacterium]